MENLSPVKARLTQYDSDSCLSEDYDRCDEFGGSSKYTLRSRGESLNFVHIITIFLIIIIRKIINKKH